MTVKEDIVRQFAEVEELRRIYDLTHPQPVESRLKFGLWTLGMGFVLGLIAGAMLWR